MIRSLSAACPRTRSTNQSVRSVSDRSGSVRSSSSSSSRRYSIKSNRTSEVDELLFASGQKQCNNNNQSSSLFVNETRPNTHECYTPVRQVVRVISPNSYRHLHAIDETRKEKSLTLTEPQLKKMINYTIAKEDESDHLKRKYLESVERRRKFVEFDKIRISRETNSDLQKLHKDEARDLIKKALEERIENEAEVKEIKNLIKAATVQTIWDRQVKEKQLLKEIQVAENIRLNKLVQGESDASFEKQKEMERQRLEKEYIGAHVMVEQMEENRNRRLQELELLATENVAAKLEAERLIVNNMMDKQRHMLQQRKRRDEFVIANKDISERKMIAKMEEKLFDEQIMKIQFEKGERERIKEEEMIRKKFEREKEYARMRELQERIQDLQSQRDELLERRAAEEAQRKWRERELIEEQKKREVENELQMIRAVQKHMAILRNANEASREKEVFEYNLKKQKLLIDKEKFEEKTKQNKKHLYAKALAHQIEQNKIQNIFKMYRKKLDEAEIAKELEVRKSRIKEAKLRVLEQSRYSGVAEKYLQQIENRINNPVTILRN